MKRRIVTFLTLVFSATMLISGCGNNTTSVTTNSTEVETVTTEIEESTVEATPEVESEPVHEHAYAEEVTTAPTCLADGITTFTCECGDTYTEPITATGHVFETYVSNEDATYLADGTETATCVCGETDTRTAEGSMLTYTYTDMDATMYAQQTVNVRSLPSTDGEKLGGLSTNDEVKVTGQCAETNWYRIEFDGNVAYVSNNYLGNDKVVVQASAPAAPAQSASTEFPYELCKVYNDGSIAWVYAVPSQYTPEWSPEYCAATDACAAWNRTTYPLNPEAPGYPSGFLSAVEAAGGNALAPGGLTLKTSWYVNGERVVKVMPY